LGESIAGAGPSNPKKANKHERIPKRKEEEERFEI
jgi:hypothetical protein